MILWYENFWEVNRTVSSRFNFDINNFDIKNLLSL